MNKKDNELISIIITLFCLKVILNVLNTYPRMDFELTEVEFDQIADSVNTSKQNEGVFQSGQV